MILIILSPARYAKACADGIALWAKAVLPTLFPFLILTAILTKLGAAETLTRRAAPLSGKHRIPPATAYCFFMSILSGYPVGSRIVADLAKNGEIGEKEAARIGAVCSTSGPMFLIGSVGGTMFGDAKAGAILFASHLLGVLLVCLAFLPFLKPLPASPHCQTDKTADNLLSDSVHGAVVSILCVGGFIAAFYVLFLALSDMRLLTPVSNFLSLFFPEQVAEGICAGLLEATQGCARLASTQSIFALPAAAFCTTFGGASILAQQLSFLQGAGVKTFPFIGIKALQGIASFLLCLGLSALFC